MAFLRSAESRALAGAPIQLHRDAVALGPRAMTDALAYLHSVIGRGSTHTLHLPLHVFNH